MQLPEKGESLRLLSHLIATQRKWMNRITKAVPDSEYGWYGETYDTDTIARKWAQSIEEWQALATNADETGLNENVYFNRAADGKKMMVRLIDLFLQINYHNMHHRAQINKLISAQGITPPATDYIFTVLREAPEV